MEIRRDNHSSDDNISMEEIAEIVERYIHEDEDVSEYSVYDVPLDKVVKAVDKEKADEIERYTKKEKNIKEKKPTEENFVHRFDKKEKIRTKKSYLKTRYMSIDTIRGISIIAIIFASGLGISEELPKYLYLSSWNGITFADLGVPVFILSTCFMIPTKVEIDIRKKLGYKEISIKKIKKGVILFLSGILLNIIVSRDFNHFRIMGILQFLGIIYILLNMLYIVFRRFKFKINVTGIIVLILGIIGSLLYFMISKKFGYDIKNCLAYFVDSKVFAGHFVNFERYGIVSTISAIFAGMIGLAGGSFVCDKKIVDKEKSTRLMIMGMALIIIALIIERNCPYNVNIWSPSFVMLVSGGFSILFSVMYIIFDVDVNDKLDLLLSPFVVLGSNSILLIVLNEILVNTILKMDVYSVAMGDKIGFSKWVIIDMLSEIFGESSRSIAFVAIYLMICFMFMLFIYKNKNTIKSK